MEIMRVIEAPALPDIPEWVLDAFVGKDFPVQSQPDDELAIEKDDAIRVLEENGERQASDWLRRNLDKVQIILPSAYFGVRTQNVNA